MDLPRNGARGELATASSALPNTAGKGRRQRRLTAQAHRTGARTRARPAAQSAWPVAKTTRTSSVEGRPSCEATVTAGKDPLYASGWCRCGRSTGEPSGAAMVRRSESRICKPGFDSRSRSYPTPGHVGGGCNSVGTVCTRRVCAASVPPAKAISAAPNDGGDAGMRLRAAVGIGQRVSSTAISQVAVSPRANRSRDWRGETRTYSTEAR